MDVFEKPAQSKKWLIVAKSPQGASERVGLVNALEYAQQQSRLQYQITGYQKANSLLGWCDCVIFSRVIDYRLIPLLDTALKMNKITFYYLDDSLYNVPSYARLRVYYHSEEVQNTLRYFIANTHQLITCSEWLSNSYDDQYSCKSTWIQPAVKVPSFTKVNINHDNIIIGFAGNIDYGERLERIKDVFIHLYHKYPTSIQFEFFGPKVSFLKDIKATYYLPKAYSTYEIALAQKKWDIGIAYLENSTFNNSKFFNKYLEYGRFKIPSIYSDIPLYNRVIKDGINGILALNTSEGWYQHIEMLICNKYLRNKIAENAYQDIASLFSPEKGAQSLIKQLGKYF